MLINKLFNKQYEFQYKKIKLLCEFFLESHFHWDWLLDKHTNQRKLKAFKFYRYVGIHE